MSGEARKREHVAGAFQVEIARETVATIAQC